MKKVKYMELSKIQIIFQKIIQLLYLCYLNLYLRENI